MIVSDVGSAALGMVEGSKEGCEKCCKGFVILLWELMEVQENIFPHWRVCCKHQANGKGTQGTIMGAWKFYV